MSLNLKEKINFDDTLKFSETTNLIKVTVFPSYFEEFSDITEGKFSWSYKIVIENSGPTRVKLLKRHFKIIDQNSVSQIVNGDGVVDQKPIIKPNDSFEYSSFVLLRAPSGIMMGSYTFLDFDLMYDFEVLIPAFTLDKPGTKITIN